MSEQPNHQWAEHLTSVNSTQTLASLRKRLRESNSRAVAEVLGHDSTPAPREPIRFQPEVVSTPD